jgi:antirestriction protein ArdC
LGAGSFVEGGEDTLEKERAHEIRDLRELDDTPEIPEAKPARSLSKTEQLRQGFVEKIVDLMEQGEAPWQQPWRLPPTCMPVNAVSGKRYNGNNIFYLMTAGMEKGYSDPRWITYKQAQEQGWQVRKGETGTKIEYWNEYDPTKTKKGEKQLDEHIQRMIDAGASPGKIEEAQESYRVGYIKHYTVFNAAQIEGIPLLKTETVIKEFKANERAEKIMDNCGVPIVYGSTKAFYSSSKDRISMPDRELFVDEEHFYATALHEIAHSTGHPSRLDREEGMKSRFGTHEYAKEELRAEMASLFIHAGIGLVVTEEGMKEHTEEHAAYVQNWMKSLKQDYKEFYRAARDANKIADYVLAYERAQERSEIDSEAITAPGANGEAARAVPIEAPASGKSFDPQPGQRVVFQPHEGTARLTGEVVRTDENSVTLQCGRATIPALREKGTFTEVPEPDRSQTKEYAYEQALKHVGEKGHVFMARGEDAIYRGAIVELTPGFAIQKVREDAVLHRLKDLEKAGSSLIQEGQEVSIAKGVRGEIFVEPRNREQTEQKRESGQSR